MKKSTTKESGSSKTSLQTIKKSPSQTSKNTTPKATSMTIFDCAIPVYEISKKFGLMIFPINYTVNGEMECSELRFKDIFWFIFSVSWSSVFGFLSASFLIPVTAQDVETSILIRSIRVLLTIGSFLCSISTVINMLNRHRLVDILKMLNAFDKEIRAFAVYVDCEKEKKFVQHFLKITALFTWIGTIIVYFSYSWLFENETNFTIFIHMCANTLVFGQSAALYKQYILLLMCLRSRFRLMNALLGKRLLKYSVQIIEINKIDQIFFVKTMCGLHNKLSQVMDNINLCYSFQIMISMGLCLSHFLLSFYTIYRNITQKNELTSQLTYVNLINCTFYAAYCLSSMNCASTLMIEVFI
ncbi:uncharacterized protein LOC129579645 [Sitodiplosis mosellana]|uniref:uncharacterized protein LOC129579645 n=1 Tax=Sitodiplosis mosellana TaxID=263140 RepID=UPI002444DEC8|nr:uncharacterized protein LOC129579645 [Sitodiplosis mosellana]